MTTKKATAGKTVTKTSISSKTIIRDADTKSDTTGETHAATTTAGPVRQAVTHPPPAPQPRAESQDANGPGRPQADTAPASTETQAETRPAGVTHHDADQATLEQLNGQLAAIRGLPQYAELEREITDRIATLSAPLVRE